MPKIVDVEGIGPKYTEKLKGAGIRTTDRLLREGSSPAGRKNIASKTGISDSLILEWVNHADLYRIKGVGSEYSDLLEEAGVDTVVELAQRKGDNLYEKIIETNTAKKLVRKLPTNKQVNDWISQAKKLPRMVKY